MTGYSNDGGYHNTFNNEAGYSNTSGYKTFS